MNHYQVLQVDFQATQQEIKQSYRRLAKKFHPDSLRQTADHNKIVELNAAYEILSNPRTRHQYDQQLQSISANYCYSNRQARNTEAQQQYQRYRQVEKTEEIQYYQLIPFYPNFRPCKHDKEKFEKGNRVHLSKK